MRRRYPSAPESVSADGATNASAGGETGVSPVHSGTEAVPVRAARVQISGEYVGILSKVSHNFAATLSDGVIAATAAARLTPSTFFSTNSSRSSPNAS